MNTEVNGPKQNQVEYASMPIPCEYKKKVSQMDVVLGVEGRKGFANASTGKSVPTQVLEQHDFQELVPKLDESFVFNPELCKNIILGLQENFPIMLWGYHGSGKTKMLQNICAATNRPFVRVQHTGNTEESDIIGQIGARDGATYFEAGILPLAMRYGWVLCLDEYDFADPSVLSVYQPVLEGEPLFIKEAPPSWRMVSPHQDFRIVATGNTNGSGDDSGLYQGTSLGNAANYSRFSITLFNPYMNEEDEVEIIARTSGARPEDAKRLAQFAGMVRDAFIKGKITNTIGHREIIKAARLGVLRSSWLIGLELAFINRTDAHSRKEVELFAQQVFGKYSAINSSKDKGRK